MPKELFDRVPECKTKNKRAPARQKAENEYLLITKLYCGKCGAFMVGESVTSHTMKVHHYYRCVNTKKKLEENKSKLEVSILQKKCKSHCWQKNKSLSGYAVLVILLSPSRNIGKDWLIALSILFISMTTGWSSLSTIRTAPKPFPLQISFVQI